MDTPNTLEVDEATRKAVSRWVSRITDAEAKWSDSFDLMRQWMDFAAGIQWQGQMTLDEDRYIANVTLQTVNQKTATLYAKNPTVKAQRRDRLDYQLWDGRLESLAVAIENAQASGGQDMESMAIIMDYQHGQHIKQIVEKVGKTTEILYKWQTDNLEPGFKKQMKQLVLRTEICGVGYVKQTFIREFEQDELTVTAMDTSMVTRMKRAQLIMKQLEAGDFTEDDERVEQLRNLLASVQATSASGYPSEFGEKLHFDFPSSRCIIPSKSCTNLDGFIGATWVAEKHVLPLDLANAFFGLNMASSSLVKAYNSGGQVVETKSFLPNQNGITEQENPFVVVYEVYNKIDKTCFFVSDCWPDYLETPSPVEPCTKHFWPWFTLIFNHIETDDSTKASIFPPSDVQLMMGSQKEWNRTRNALRSHRKANAPKTAARAGVLTEADKANLQSAPDNAVIELQGLLAGDTVANVLQPIPKHPIDPACYDTQGLLQDVLMTTGQQEANFGSTPAARKGETATSASIAESSRQTKASSNVDDLDDLLSELARNGGELMMYEMSLETVRKICGPGAVWPTINRADFVQALYLEVEAGSSGRPNKAMDTATWQQMAPILMQMGANPQFIVRETIKRTDDRLNPADAFPLLPTTNSASEEPDSAINGGQQQQGAPAQQQLPPNAIPLEQPQQLPNGTPAMSMVPTQ